MAAKAKDDIAGMSFEDALGELETIVSQLENGEASLEKSIDLYVRGSRLKAHCDAKLRDAEMRVEKIVPAGAGEEPKVAPFEGTTPVEAKSAKTRSADGPDDDIPF